MPHELLDLLAERSICHFFLSCSGYWHMVSPSSRFSGDISTQRASKKEESPCEAAGMDISRKRGVPGFNQRCHIHAIGSSIHLIQSVIAHIYTEFRLLLEPRTITNRSNGQIKGYPLASPEPVIDWG